jgi:hypothetical protein
VQTQPADRQRPPAEITLEFRDQRPRVSWCDLVLNGDVWPPTASILRANQAMKVFG